MSVQERVTKSGEFYEGKDSYLKKEVVPTEIIENRIFIIRGQRVMLDSDLAEIYCVTTKRFNEQFRRNIERFPSDFAFKLTRGRSQ